MMSDNDIRKEFQSKLSGFEAPVPMDGWDGVERSLQAAAAARVLFRRRWWYAGSAAAVMVLVIGSILFMRNPIQSPEVMVSESIPAASPIVSDTSGESIKETELSPEGDVSRSKERYLAIGKKKEFVKKRKGLIVEPAAPRGIFTAWMDRNNLKVTELENKIVPGNIRLPANAGKTDAKQYDSDFFVEERIIVEEGQNLLSAGEIADEKGTGPFLLAVNGRGGLTGYQQTVNSPMTLRSASPVMENKYSIDNNKAQLQADNIAGNVSEMEHDQPISVGITVSRYLSEDLSVETGLVYSYLHSKTRNTNNNFQVEEVQKLHYLGIPLNVNYNLFSFHKLNVYASVGGMIEKDISGEYKRLKEGQPVTLNNSSEESTAMEVEKISQKKPQFSVNAGVGVSYPLYDRLRLYGKIGGAYYFDAKNEYKTIYSDRKIVLDMNVGLRYEF
ncbi:outer membrane beta-barrel protein [Proteiniphilum sp. UBA5384]|uniref:outer membrane beta-barrel protein n=1 Tax=Proteiniphilum sp. UBA5384 TaxID=1947279 RepID=UPI0025CC0B90|nr:outer membrane beta-barrel protein [Proteiniphilum sp. UBA5384]